MKGSFLSVVSVSCICCSVGSRLVLKFLFSMVIVVSEWLSWDIISVWVMMSWWVEVMLFVFFLLKIVAVFSKLFIEVRVSAL